MNAKQLNTSTLPQTCSRQSTLPASKSPQTRPVNDPTASGFVLVTPYLRHLTSSPQNTLDLPNGPLVYPDLSMLAKDPKSVVSQIDMPESRSQDFMLGKQELYQPPTPPTPQPGFLACNDENLYRFLMSRAEGNSFSAFHNDINLPSPPTSNEDTIDNHHFDTGCIEEFDDIFNEQATMGSALGGLSQTPDLHTVYLAPSDLCKKLSS